MSWLSDITGIDIDLNKAINPGSNKIVSEASKTDVQLLLKNGYTIKQLIKLGVSVQELRLNGVTVEQLVDAGVSASDILNVKPETPEDKAAKEAAAKEAAKLKDNYKFGDYYIKKSVAAVIVLAIVAIIAYAPLK